MPASKSKSKSRSKSRSKSPPKTRKSRSQAGVAMPKHRIAEIIAHEKRMYTGYPEEYFIAKRMNLESFRFKRSDVNADSGFWSSTVITYSGANQMAIPSSKLF